MEKTTMGKVRRDFTHARYLMKMANEIMKDSSRTNLDYTNDGDAMQIAYELTACATTFEAWVSEQLHKGSKKC